MPGLTARAALLLCLACSTVLAQAADPSVVRTEAQLKTVLASGQPTPLDALTPHGKRSLLRSIRWREDGAFNGFNFLVITRELDARQLVALLTFLGSEDLLPMLSRELDGPAIRLPEPSPGIEEKLQRFTKEADDNMERRRTAAMYAGPRAAADLQVHYRNLFGERMELAALGRQPLGDLLPLFEAARTMNFYYPGTALRDMMQVHRELVARGVPTARQLDGNVLDALLSARRFDEARTFAFGKPGLSRQTIPVVADPLGPGFKGRSLYRYDSASNTLTREAAPVPNGLQLVMVVGAGCHFSAQALAALQSDADLQARLRQARLLLVTSPSTSIPLDYIATWNAGNPTIPIRAPYDMEEWKGVDPTGVPTFYVLKDGKTVGQLHGWAAKGNKAALVALLDAARQ